LDEGGVRQTLDGGGTHQLQGEQKAIVKEKRQSVQTLLVREQNLVRNASLKLTTTFFLYTAKYSACGVRFSTMYCTFSLSFDIIWWSNMASSGSRGEWRDESEKKRGSRKGENKLDADERE
jgi:hypothetical protein